MMLVLIVTGLFFGFGAFILPWILLGRIRVCEESLARLTSSVREPRYKPKEYETWLPETSVPQMPTKAAGVETSYKVEGVQERQEKPVFRDKKSKKLTFEQQFGARLPVWIGGIALALSGFFMVKYSIENVLLSPAVRTLLGFVFGGALLAAGEMVRHRPLFANGQRIAQALTGAGIVDLYACFYAAANLYDMISPTVGFAGMVAVTVSAVMLSLRHGVPIALFALVGGFLTPALISSQSPQAPLLFIYLYVLVAGMLYLIRREGWWWMSIMTVIGSFAWTALWAFGRHFTSGDALCVGLFAFAVCATVSAMSDRNARSEEGGPAKLAGILAISGAVLIMSLVLARASYTPMSWALFTLMSVASIVLAALRQEPYRLAPLGSLAVTSVMLLVWRSAPPVEFAVVTSVMAALYMLSGFFMQFYSRKPLEWGVQSLVAAFVFYGLAWVKLDGWSELRAIPHFWSGLALGISVAAVYATSLVMKIFPDDNENKQNLLGVQAAAATGFLSIAFGMILDNTVMPVALSGQMMALAWFSSKLNIKHLREIVMMLGFAILVFLFPQMLNMYGLILNSLLDLRWFGHIGILYTTQIIIGLATTGVFLGVCSVLLRQRKDESLVKACEAFGIILLGLAGYYALRQILGISPENLYLKLNFIQRGVATNIMFLMGFLCLLVGRKFDRSAIRLCGFVIATMAAFRVGYFDLLTKNPYDRIGIAGQWPILNGLLLAYGLPAIWFALLTKYVPVVKKKWVPRLFGASLVLLFVLITYQLRHYFYISADFISTYSNIEVYSYSVAWLLYGVGLLLAGTYRNIKALRIASLAVIVVTVGKVFLYDSSELSGLYRVFSFLGLGVSLLALSWFYTRYVFKRSED